MEDGEKASDLSLSLDQSIDILEAIVNDTITQTSSYEKGMIKNILKALKKVVVSLQSYLFSDIDFQSMKRPHATLEAFVRLLSLQFHIEMHINAKQSLEKAKQDPTDASWIEKQYSNPLIGSIPTSMLELCTILRREILPFNETGGSEPIRSSIGCYCLSLLHLLLVHSTKCASLLLFDEQVPQTKRIHSKYTSLLAQVVRSYLCAVFESDPAKVKNQLTIRRQGDTFEEDPSDVLPLIKRVLTQHILPAFVKWLQGIQWMTVSIPNFVFYKRIAVMALETIHHFGFAPIRVLLLPSGEFPSHRERIDSSAQIASRDPPRAHSIDFASLGRSHGRRYFASK